MASLYGTSAASPFAIQPKKKKSANSFLNPGYGMAPVANPFPAGFGQTQSTAPAKSLWEMPDAEKRPAMIAGGFGGQYDSPQGKMSSLFMPPTPLAQRGLAEYSAVEQHPTMQNIRRGQATAAIPIRPHPSEAFQQHQDAMNMNGEGSYDPSVMQGPLPQATSNGGSYFAPPLRGPSGETGPNDYERLRQPMVIPGGQDAMNRQAAAQAEAMRQEQAGAILQDTDRAARLAFGGPLPTSGPGAMARIGPGAPSVFNNFEDWKRAKIAGREAALRGETPPAIGAWDARPDSPGNAPQGYTGTLRGEKPLSTYESAKRAAKARGDESLFADHMAYVKGNTQDQQERKALLLADRRGVDMTPDQARFSVKNRRGDKITAADAMAAGVAPASMAFMPDSLDAARNNAMLGAIGSIYASDLPPDAKADAARRLMSILGSPSPFAAPPTTSPSSATESMTPEHKTRVSKIMTSKGFSEDDDAELVNLESY